MKLLTFFVHVNNVFGEDILLHFTILSNVIYHFTMKKVLKSACFICNHGKIMKCALFLLSSHKYIKVCFFPTSVIVTVTRLIMCR
jgi:hypothetical protein